MHPVVKFGIFTFTVIKLKLHLDDIRSPSPCFSLWIQQADK